MAPSILELVGLLVTLGLINYGSLVVGCVGSDAAFVGPSEDVREEDPGADACANCVGGDADAATDAPSDARACDLGETFNAPQPVLGAPLFDSAWFDPSETETVASIVIGDAWHLARGVRSSPSEPFPAFGAMNSVNGVAWETRGPALSADRLRLFFFTNGPLYALWTSTRASTRVDFSAPVRVGLLPPALAGKDLVFPWWIDDEHLIVNTFEAAYRVTFNGTDLTTASEISELKPLGANRLKVTADESLVVFGTAFSGKHHLYEAKRVGTTYQEPRLISELQGTTEEFPQWLSPDGCRLYFVREGETGVLMATRK